MKRSVFLNILLLISIVIIIKYSNFPLWNLPLNIERLFIKPINNDGIVLNIGIAYFSSYVFYLLVVYYPDKDKKNRVYKSYLNELRGIYIDNLLLILTIYKSTCTKNEWESIKIDSDKDFFKKEFFNRMQLFDGYSEAVTPQCKIDESGNCIKLQWDEYIENKILVFIDQIDSLLNKYLIFLESKEIEMIFNFRDNDFYAYFVALHTSNTITIIKGENNEKYAERLPLSKIMQSNQNLSGIFANKNISMIENYSESLINLFEYLLKNKKT